MTAPLVPAEVDLRDFSFMPLDVRRLLTSETWIEAADNPRVGHASMCLWAESWHQVPAASLPDNDKVLARLAMCDAKTWKRIRDLVLAGWVKCEDGLLYHPVVAEKARESWEFKLKQRARTQAATEAREAKRRAEQSSRDGGRDDQRDVARDARRDVHQETGQGPDQTFTTPEGLPRTDSHLAARSPAADHAIALNRIGVRVTASDPRLLDAVADGVTAKQLTDLAEAHPGKGAPYLIATARGQLRDGATTPSGTANGTHQPRESLVDRNARRAAEILGRTGTE